MRMVEFAISVPQLVDDGTFDREALRGHRAAQPQPGRVGGSEGQDDARVEVRGGFL
jgi:hypothetical protein